jgi:carbon storage regulator CsrA
MLILSRKVGERIVLADGAITIELLATRGGQARIGVAAPASVVIRREAARAPAPRRVQRNG